MVDCTVRSSESLWWYQTCEAGQDKIYGGEEMQMEYKKEVTVFCGAAIEFP